MKEEILKRAMFAMPLSKSAKNSGIMEGFEEDENADLDEMPPMARTPQNPEILMNNLRGDMRSFDARYDELADLVGEEVAYETPPEILAMLQPVLAQQNAGGIASLGGAPEMPPAVPPGAAPGAPPGMPPGAPAAMPAGPAAGMPPPPPEQMPGGGIADLAAAAGAAPPGGEMPPPQGLARGGIVQHFSEGSDEEGVTQAASYPPELVQAAKNWAATRFGGTSPTQVQDLRSLAAGRLPMYNELLGLGKSKEDMQSQLLLDIASRGLGFAGNVDEQGRPLTGSFASRLGQVTRTMPNTVLGMLEQQRKGEMAARQLALQAAEKEMQQAAERDIKTEEARGKLFTSILKADATAQGKGMFPQSQWAWAVVNKEGLMERWGAGLTNMQEDKAVQSALSVLQKPILETRIDPVTKQPYTQTIDPVLPMFVVQAVEARQKADKAPATTRPTAGGAAGQRPTGAEGAVAPSQLPSAVAPSFFQPGEPTLFNLAEKGTGPINVSAAFLTRVPILGEFVKANDQVQATSYISNAVNSINRGLATNPRFAEGERKQIQGELSLAPSLIDRAEAYRERLIAIDDLLMGFRDDAYKKGYKQRNLGPEEIQAARLKVEDIDGIRKVLGMPPRVNSMADFTALPNNSLYILRGKLYMKNAGQPTN